MGRGSGVPDDVHAAVVAAAIDFAEARANRERAVNAAREIAIELYNAGMTEVELATRLNVDRARTIRRWLNKQPKSQAPTKKRSAELDTETDGDGHVHSAFCADSHDPPNVLYRMYDSQDRLLYVGITVDPAMRFAHHRGSKAWWREIARIALSHYDCRVDLARAERAAIRDEHPLHNISLNQGWDGAIVEPEGTS